jgi:hypothetical protein
LIDKEKTQEIIFRISILDASHPQYFYKLPVKEKLAHVLRLKEVATKFFKSDLENRFKKAAAIY